MGLTVPCGDPALVGGQWDFAGGDGGTGAVLLRASPSLCLSWLSVAQVVVEACSDSAAQLWTYNSAASMIRHNASGLCLAIAVGAFVGTFAPVGLGACGHTAALWWSPDNSTGFIHSAAAAPLQMACLGVCSTLGTSHSSVNIFT